MPQPSSDSSNPRLNGFAVLLLLGPLLFLLVWYVSGFSALNDLARRVAAVAVWMSWWWITGVVPVSATALLPFALFPFLGVMDGEEATRHFAHWLNFLMLGGFMIAAAMERWNLHRRVALTIICWIGVTPRRIVLGFMVATAFISMWINNTASTVMMIPVAMAVLARLRQMTTDSFLDRFAPCLMLSIAYAASIGGVGTLIGTAPNGIFVSITHTIYDQTFGFLDWIKIGLPMVFIMLPLVWLYLVRIHYPLPAVIAGEAGTALDTERRALGPLNRGEKIVAGVIVFAMLGWIFRQPFDFGFMILPGLQQAFPMVNTDACVALMAAMILLITPVNWRERTFVLDMPSVMKIPWDVLFIIGGGVCLAHGFSITGLSNWMADQLSVLSGLPPYWMLLICITAITFITEVTSNTATATLMIPLMGAVAVGLGQNPLFLMIPTSIAVSMAFMLPVATPPNAVIFGSGHVSSRQMARTGFWVNWVAVLVIFLVFTFLTAPLFGIHLNQVPEWAYIAAPPLK